MCVLNHPLLLQNGVGRYSNLLSACSIVFMWVIAILFFIVVLELKRFANVSLFSGVKSKMTTTTFVPFVHKGCFILVTWLMHRNYLPKRHFPPLWM